MTILRTHTSYEGQISWDQKLARAQDILRAVEGALFCGILSLVVAVLAMVLYRLVRA